MDLEAGLKISPEDESLKKDAENVRKVIQTATK